MKISNVVKKTKLKVKDTVQVIAGKDFGAIGKVISIDTVKNRLRVAGVRLQTNFKKRTEQEKGGMFLKEGPVDISNVLLYCPSCQRGVRFATKVAVKEVKTPEGILVSRKVKTRVCKKCHTEIKDSQPATTIESTIK